MVVDISRQLFRQSANVSSESATFFDHFIHFISHPLRAMTKSAAAGFRASRLFHPSGTEVHLHTHDEGQLTLALRGTVRIRDDTGWHLATPGTAIWVPPRRRRRASYPKTCELIRVHLPEAAQPALPEDCVLLPLSNLAIELIREATRLSAARAQEQERQLIQQLLLVQLRQRQPLQDLFIHEGRDKRVRAITRYLRDHPASNETLAHLALRAATSERTLARHFEEDTGLSFRQWRDRLRIVNAIERMIQGQPLVAVALDLGYQSSSSFSTAFARLIGMPPGQYLKQFINAEYHAGPQL